MPETRTSREDTVLGVAVAFLVVLVALLVVLPCKGGGPGFPGAAGDATPASAPEEGSREQVARVTVVPFPGPGPVEDGVPAPVQEVAGTLGAAPAGDLAPGAFPEIAADYAETIGFDTYKRALAGIGARFFVVRRPAFDLVTEVDPVDYAFVSLDDAALGRLSPRSRDLSAEPRLQDVLARAGRVFGDGRYAAVVLLPRAVEQRVVIALSEIERAAQVEVDTFNGVYRLKGDALALQVTGIRTRAGRMITVNRTVRLTAGH